MKKAVSAVPNSRVIEVNCCALHALNLGSETWYA